jgi:erythromycin esterase
MMSWQRAFKRKWVIATIAVCLLSPFAVIGFLKLNRIEISPRPVPSQVLQDDTSLARTNWLPDVNKSWQQDVIARHQPIRSLFSDDFSDLQFLKPLLKDKRLVMLGESSHGVAEYSWMKARLVRFLHREMGFDVLAFEGSMAGAYYVDKDVGSKPAVESLRNAVFGTWWTAEVKDVFEYLRVSRQQGLPLTFAGFDIQDSGAPISAYTDVLFKQVLQPIEPAIQPTLLNRLDGIEQKLFQASQSPSPSAQDLREVAAFYRQASETLSVHRARLETLFPEEPMLVALALQQAQSRINFAEKLRLATSDYKRSNDVRDAAMAVNLNFLMDNMYPNRKVIVWAHHAHIGVGYPYKYISKSMGSWIAEARKAETYSIGLFMGRGGHVKNAFTKTVEPFWALEGNSLEAIMASANRKMSFVDFSRASPSAGNEWIFTPINAKDWGVNPIKFVPRDVFDAVIYIDDVTPPKYL